MFFIVFCSFCTVSISTLRISKLLTYIFNVFNHLIDSFILSYFVKFLDAKFPEYFFFFFLIAVMCGKLGWKIHMFVTFAHLAVPMK